MPDFGFLQKERDRIRSLEQTTGNNFRRRESRRVRNFESEESERNRQFQSSEASADFDRRSGLAREFFGKFQDEFSSAPGGEPQGPSESEQILIQAQEEAGVEEVNRLQDTLSSAGILSSGTLAVGTGKIIGAARAGVARTSAGFAESRLTRRHQQLLAKRQALTQLISSILI